MKFRNPWIDPRILKVRPADAQAYLLCRGWEFLGPSQNPDLLLFAWPGREDSPTLHLPIRMGEGAEVQRMIELVGAVALFENRFAGDVLTEILQDPTDHVQASVVVQQ